MESISLIQLDNDEKAIISLPIAHTRKLNAVKAHFNYRYNIKIGELVIKLKKSSVSAIIVASL